MKVESALAGFTPLGYTEIITAHTFSFGISTGDGRFHDSRKGWGTFSSDGKSITWDHWRPPTKEEIEAQRARIEWLKSPEGQECLQKTEREMDEFMARCGTSRAKVWETLSKVIRDAPPMRFES